MKDTTCFGFDNMGYARSVNIIAYQIESTIIFLYTDGIKKPVSLDIKSGKHSVLKRSNKSPMRLIGLLVFLFAFKRKTNNWTLVPYDAGPLSLRQFV